MHTGITRDRTVASGLIGFDGTPRKVNGIGPSCRGRRDRRAVGGCRAAVRAGRGTWVARVAALLVAALLAGCAAWIDDDTVTVTDEQGSGVESTRDAGPRVALVIGNEKYGSAIGRLENPVRDAQSVASALKKAGFTVEFEDDLAEDAFHAALDAFSEDSARASTAAFYYAGHGMEEGSVNYLLPVDMQKPTATHNAVELDEVIKAMKAQRNLVFLDACRTPPGRGLRGGDSPLSRGLAAVALKQSVDDLLISYAAWPGSPALDGKAGGNSPYAKALATHMVKEGLRLTDLLMKVKKSVKDLTDGDQVPWQSGSPETPFYFVPPEPEVEQPPKVDPDKVKPDGGAVGGGGTVDVDPRPVVLPEWERECERILGIEDPARAVVVRAYVEKYQGEPAAAVCVAEAKVLAGKLEQLAKPPPLPVVSGTSSSASGVRPGTSRPAVGDVWESPLGMEFAWVPAGRFVMGSPGSEAGRWRDEGPQREVRISQGFWLGRYEVTQGEWEAVMGSNPAFFKGCGSRCPVETVSWEEVQGFIGRLNGQESGRGNRYRLPTEAEWEYAARAGTVGERHGELDSIAWWDRNSDRRAHAVGRKRGNGWGLHDMLGNVWEWTADWYGEYPSGSATDPADPSRGSGRVIRGGGWRDIARSVRSANRNYRSPGSRSGGIGFRLVRTK